MGNAYKKTIKFSFFAFGTYAIFRLLSVFGLFQAFWIAQCEIETKIPLTFSEQELQKNFQHEKLAPWTARTNAKNCSVFSQLKYDN